MTNLIDEANKVMEVIEMLLIGIFVLVFLECLWYIPIYRKSKSEDRVNKKKIVFAFLWGFIPAFVISVILSGLIDRMAKSAGVGEQSLLYSFIISFIEYALVEELIKFLFSKISIRKLDLSHINTVLIFGAVGMGFNILESTLFMATVNPIAGAIFRGVCGGHIFYQFWMGYYVWLAWQAKKSGDALAYRKNLLIGLAVPILVHGMHDFAAQLAKFVDTGIEMVPFVTAFVIDMIFLFITIRKVYELTKAHSEND